MALQQKTIELEDAIDLRDYKNIKLANQMLKNKKKKKARKRSTDSITKYTSTNSI